MKCAIKGAAILLATGLWAGAAPAAAAGSCSVTHHQCYPACVQMTPDGSDCARTRTVCKDICGPAPVYPSSDENIDVRRFEGTAPAPVRQETPDSYEAPEQFVPPQQ